MKLSKPSWSSTVAIGLTLVASGCSKSSPPPPAASAPANQAPQHASSPIGTVTGNAPPPNPGALVVVLLEPKTARSFPPQSEKPVMDQVGQTFGPELLFVRTGQPVEFRNSDEVLHNVHVSNEDTHEGAFNVAIPTGSSYTYTFQRDGFYHVGCDIHPAMAAEIVSTTSPYATITEPDGRFVFTDVAPGSYTLTVYANGRKIQRDVEVTAGTTEVNASPPAS